MARTGVTREQIFDVAEAILQQGFNPTVLRVREQLGGGSPNTIAPLLAEWKGQQDQVGGDGQPDIPESIERMLRQVWGAAWQEAQAHLADERSALTVARKSFEQERTELFTEISRLEGELETLRTQAQQCDMALTETRETLAQLQVTAREAEVRVQERGERLAALEHALEAERKARHEAEQALNLLKVESATLTERASQAETLRELIESLKGDSRK